MYTNITYNAHLGIEVSATFTRLRFAMFSAVVNGRQGRHTKVYKKIGNGNLFKIAEVSHYGSKLQIDTEYHTEYMTYDEADMLYTIERDPDSLA